MGTFALRAIALLAVAIGLATPVGWSQSASPGTTGKRPAMRTGAGFGPCADDVQQFCPGVKPGQGRVAKCLQQHEAQVSPACREFAQRKRAEFNEAKGPCAADAKRLCPEVKPGQGRVAACLKSHESDLSPACRADLPK